MKSEAGMVFFDFDGTISKKDSFLAFILYTRGPLKLLKCLVIHLPKILLLFLKIYPNHRLKEDFFTFFFKGESVDMLEQAGQNFCESSLPRLIFPDALRLIQWHQTQGHSLFLLTASSRIWLEKWCNQHQITCIGTEFETSQGLYTGKIKGKNCQGETKANIVQSMLSHEPTMPTFGYGNGKSDSYFLSLMDRGFNGPLNRKNVDKILKKNRKHH